jgi:hypothetical protein
LEAASAASAWLRRRGPSPVNLPRVGCILTEREAAPEAYGKLIAQFVKQLNTPHRS